MTKRFILDDGLIYDNGKEMEDVVGILNELHEENEEIGNALDDMVTFKNKYRDKYKKLETENEQLKQQKAELLRLIDNNIEIYENINTNVEFHQGEIQGKLTVLNNLREVILND